MPAINMSDDKTKYLQLPTVKKVRAGQQESFCCIVATYDTQKNCDFNVYNEGLLVQMEDVESAI